MQQKIAVVFGSSGLIGREVVHLLETTSDIKEIILPVRRINHDFQSTKVKQVLVDFDHLETTQAKWTGDLIFLCLGTTMAKAKSREAFYLVDYIYTCNAALLACRQNPNAHLLLVSSLGADSKSLFYYSRVKGDVEKTITSLPCAKVSIFRPSLLLGNRSEKRAGEEWAARLSKALFFIFTGPLKVYKPIHAKTVALAMINEALKNHKGKPDIFLSHEIEQLAASI